MLRNILLCLKEWVSESIETGRTEDEPARM